MIEEKEYGQKFESHHILGYSNHLLNCQGINFDLKKKKAPSFSLISKGHILDLLLPLHYLHSFVLSSHALLHPQNDYMAQRLNPNRP